MSSKAISPGLRRIHSSCKRTQTNSIHFHRKSGRSRSRTQTLSRSGAQKRVAPKSASMSETIVFVVIVVGLIFLAIMKYNHEQDY